MTKPPDQRRGSRAGTSRDGLPPGDEQEGPDFTPIAGGFELYRHKSAGATEAGGWHGFYWARQKEDGDYEIRTVPASYGVHSAPGGVWPKEGFEEHYARVAR